MTEQEPLPCRVCALSASASALARTVQELRDSAHLANATLVSREITAEGVSLEGCDSYLVVADANQSRLLVSNSAHDTALPHSCLEAILASRHRLVLAVVGGRTRGFRNPEPGSVWSESVERVLRQTEQALALEVVERGAAVSWVEQASDQHQAALATLLGLRAPASPPKLLQREMRQWSRMQLVVCGVLAAAAVLTFPRALASSRERRKVLSTRLRHKVQVLWEQALAHAPLLVLAAPCVLLSGSLLLRPAWQGLACKA